MLGNPIWLKKKKKKLKSKTTSLPCYSVFNTKLQISYSFKYTVLWIISFRENINYNSISLANIIISQKCFSQGIRTIEVFDKNVLTSWGTISSYFCSPGLTEEVFLYCGEVEHLMSCSPPVWPLHTTPLLGDKSKHHRAENSQGLRARWSFQNCSNLKLPD